MLLLLSVVKLYLDEHIDEWQYNCQQDVGKRNS
jgi:hypothetical protein